MPHSNNKQNVINDLLQNNCERTEKLYSKKNTDSTVSLSFL